MARHKETFIINLWIESEPEQLGQRAECRGSVEHLSTHRRLYFAELIELIAFLARYTQHDGTT